MSDFINKVSSKKVFNKALHVEKGNQPKEFNEDSSLKEFKIHSEFYGKKLILNLSNDTLNIPIYIFMGMSGSWKWVPTNEWNQTKFTRLRLDCDDGNSLLLFGGYMGPKYSLYQKFKGNKSGPDIILDFDKFKENILNSLNNRVFQKPIYEVLLNQQYFNGIGNYLRSTLIFYADINPFKSAKETIETTPGFLELCKEVILTSYSKNGGQLKDWKNPFDYDSKDFEDWVYYQKGEKIKDSQNRTFWFEPKWKA